MPEACPRCGVRADIGCRHQPAQGSPPQTFETKKDGRSVSRGQGHAFHRPKVSQSLRGKAGNPTKREFRELLPLGWRGK